jgi:4-hydroxybenzoate polyprenyltransferase
MRKLRIFLEMIKFEHTLFALPFAFMGMMIGAVTMEGRLPTWWEFLWILLAMIGARTAAMGLNRIIDAAMDKRNPRTANRAVPAGLLRKSEVWLYVILSFILLFIASSQLNALCVILMPIAVFMLVFYSYTKRFTWLCHVVLGLTIGLAPLGAWIGVTGAFSWEAWVLYVAVVFWLAGFDTIYACQDYDFDRRNRVHSIPVRFGLAGALRLARLFHAVTVLCLFILYLALPLSWIYLAGLLISVIILCYEHMLVQPNDISRVQTAFFTMNAALSIVLFVATFLDLLIIHKW